MLIDVRPLLRRLAHVCIKLLVNLLGCAAKRDLPKRSEVFGAKEVFERGAGLLRATVLTGATPGKAAPSS